MTVTANAGQRDGGRSGAVSAHAQGTELLFGIGNGNGMPIIPCSPSYPILRPFFSFPPRMLARAPSCSADSGGRTSETGRMPVCVVDNLFSTRVFTTGRWHCHKRFFMLEHPRSGRHLPYVRRPDSGKATGGGISPVPCEMNKRFGILRIQFHFISIE